MAARLRIVWPSGDGPDARRQRFYVYSAIGHVLVVVTLILAPKLFGDTRRPFSDEFFDSIQAELVAEVPGPIASPAPQQVQPEVRPEPEPPKPQPEPEPPPETETAGDVVHSKRADPTPAKEEDPEPHPSEPVEDPGDSDPSAPTGERVGDSTGGVQGGGEISLFGWYQSSVSRALYSTWRRPPLAGQRGSLSVLISFEIRKDGSVSGLRVDQSSGVPALDRSALRAVADASPLPRLPPGWRGTSMTAAYVFELTPEDF